MDNWYREISQYNFNAPAYSNAVGHFTQLIWRNSKQLGCGMSVCNGANYWVCRYSPTGNWNTGNPGVLANNVPALCSAGGGGAGNTPTPPPPASPLPPRPPMSGRLSRRAQKAIGVTPRSNRANKKQAISPSTAVAARRTAARHFGPRQTNASHSPRVEQADIGTQQAAVMMRSRPSRTPLSFARAELHLQAAVEAKVLGAAEARTKSGRRVDLSADFRVAKTSLIKGGQSVGQKEEISGRFRLSIRVAHR